jgi:hypothetical protein
MDTTTKKELKKLDNKICCVKKLVEEGGEEEPLQGFLSMSDAVSALGLGKQFYYLESNLEGATAGSVHTTINL